MLGKAWIETDKLKSKKAREAIIQKKKELNDMLDWRLNQLRKEQEVISKLSREQFQPQRLSMIPTQLHIHKRNAKTLTELERKNPVITSQRKEKEVQRCKVSLMNISTRGKRVLELIRDDAVTDKRARTI